MTLGEMKQLVRDSLSRGNQIDGMLFRHIKIAVAWVERNYTYKYMERYRMIQLDIGQSSVALPLPSLCKSVKMVRFLDEAGRYTVLTQWNPADSYGTRVGVPSRYFLAGETQLVFDATPDAKLAGDVLVNEYSDIADVDAQSPRVLAFAPDLILYQTLMQLASYLRDPRQAELYLGLRDQALTTVNNAEDEKALSNANIEMVFHPIGSSTNVAR